MVLPSQFIARVFNLKPTNQDSKVSESIGGRRIVEKGVSHRLEFTIQTFPLNLDEAYMLAAWRDQYASSQADVFAATLPIMPNSSANIDASFDNIRVRELAPAGSMQIKLKNLPASMINVIPAFSMLQFTNHTKLYNAGISQTGNQLLVNSWNTNSIGQTTIMLTKPLIRAVPVETIVNLANAQITASPLDDSWDFEVSAANDNRVTFSLNCIEHY